MVGQNPEHLLLYAAGNDGLFKYDSGRGGICTVGTPGLSKNGLTVGASSSGIMRLTSTDSNGDPYGLGITLESASLDTVTFFSSYGPTSDGRIKPDVVAPGDQVCFASGFLVFGYFSWVGGEFSFAVKLYSGYPT